MRRICSVDGGGLKGAGTTCFLVEIEKQVGKPCWQIFDMVAGTSTGALIAAAIAAKLSATQILSIYQNRSKEIFPISSSSVGAWADRIAKGWYASADVVHEILTEEFGPAASWTMNDSPIRILLTAKGVGQQQWNLVQDTPKNGQQFGSIPMIDCAVASACAPTYFPGWYIPPGKELVGWAYDGGCGISGNPVYEAVVEATERDDFDPADTKVFSFGCGWYPDTQVNQPGNLLGVIEWLIGASTSAPITQQTEMVDRHWPGIQQRFNWKMDSQADFSDVSAIPGWISICQKLAAQLDWKGILSL